MRARKLLYLLLLAASDCSSVLAETGLAEKPEVTIGRELFNEQRFSHLAWEKLGRATNAKVNLKESVSCRTCHFQNSKVEGKERLYNDYAARSPIELREDGKALTSRNTTALVDLKPSGSNSLLFHSDGEFASMENLVFDTLTGRTMGWLPQEKQAAIKHVAAVIRNDNGRHITGHHLGGSYGTVLRGRSLKLRLSSNLSQNVQQLSDKAVVSLISGYISSFMSTIQFKRGQHGEHAGSSYDRFLRLNSLPSVPSAGENNLQYANRLRDLIEQLESPVFVNERNRPGTARGTFGEHALRGLKIFLRTSGGATGVGNCVSCHVPPSFTDLKFHNIGTSQIEYDTIHGAGAFSQLPIPSLAERRVTRGVFLPRSSRNISGSGKFSSAPDGSDIGRADLGAWNVIFNPFLARVQNPLYRQIPVEGPLSDEEVLEKSIAAFRTPQLRGLQFTAPYMHNGQLRTIDDVVNHYITVSRLARAGLLRSGDPQVARIFLGSEDFSPLMSFLSSLDEAFERSR